MRDINGSEIKVGDKIVYEYHGRGQNGLQQALVLKANPDSILVGWTWGPLDARTVDNYSGKKVTLTSSGSVLRLS